MSYVWLVSYSGRTEIGEKNTIIKYYLHWKMIFLPFFAKVFLNFQWLSSLTLSNQTYPYFKIPHERERRRDEETPKWCLTQNKIIHKKHSLRNGPSKKKFIQLIKLTYNLVVHAALKWIAKRFNATVPCCPDERRNVNLEIASGSLKTLIVTVSSIVFSIKISWYKKL